MQSRVPPDLRAFLAEYIAKRSAGYSPIVPLTPGDERVIQELEAIGGALLGRLMSTELAQHIAAIFRQTPCFAAHVAALSDGRRKTLDDARRQGAYGSYTLGDALAVQPLLALATSDRLMSIAGAYLGAPPTLYSIHVFWTFADQPGTTHQWHRDHDDFKFVSIFVYLTDVEESHGPVHFIPGSHALPAARRSDALNGQALPFDGSNAFDPAEFFPPHFLSADEKREKILNEVFEQQKLIFTGEAGTGFAMDSYGIHCGSLPAGKDRLVCWIRYGLTANSAYIVDKTEPVPTRDIPYLHLPDGVVPWPYRLILKYEK
jgi:hypothetical protein